MKPLKAELMLIVVTLFWGSSYLFMKLGLGTMGEFNLIALRFGLAFILAGLLFRRRLRSVDARTLKYGALLGFLLLGVFTCITFGLKTTTTSNAGFLVALTVVFVPMLEVLVFRKSRTPADLRSCSRHQRHRAAYAERLASDPAWRSPLHSVRCFLCGADSSDGPGGQDLRFAEYRHSAARLRRGLCPDSIGYLRNAFAPVHPSGLDRDSGSGDLLQRLRVHPAAGGPEVHYTDPHRSDLRP